MSYPVPVTGLVLNFTLTRSTHLCYANRIDVLQMLHFASDLGLHYLSMCYL